MSLVVEITKADTEKDLSGLTSLLKTLTEKISTAIGFADFSAFDSIACRGILQNNLDISFTNKWDSTVYQGVMSGIDKFTQVADGAYGKLGKVVTAAIDFSQTTLNMGGMSMIGAGAGSTKMYGGSNISGLTVSLKWYTPQASKSLKGGLEYEESIKALMALGFPTQRSGTSSSTTSSKKVDEETNKIVETLQTLFSINPPPVKLTIYNGNTIVYNIHPLVITNITLNSSRETFNGKPIVIGANISFDFYQIKGNGGYNSSEEKSKLTFAGITLLDNIKPVSSDGVANYQSPINKNEVTSTTKWTGSSGYEYVTTTDAKGNTYITQTNPIDKIEVANYKVSSTVNGGTNYLTNYVDPAVDPPKPITESFTEGKDSYGNRSISREYTDNTTKESKIEIYEWKMRGVYSKMTVERNKEGVVTDRSTEEIPASELPNTPTIPSNGSK